MKTKLLSFLLATTLLSTCVAFTSCKDNDTTPEPWVADVIKPVLTGTITTNGGTLLSGATVTVTANGKTYSATTDATGAYTIADLPAGTFAVKASHSDASYIAQEGTVTLANNETAIWDGLLMKASSDVKVETVDPVSKESVDAVYTTTLPNLTDNAQAETSTAYVIVTDKEETFEDPTDEIEMSVYEKIEEEATRAATNMNYSVVLTTSSKKGATSTKKPIRMASDKYGKPSKVLFNGKEVKTTTVGEYTYFDTQEFGTTEFIYGIKVSSSMSTETLTFNPSTFQGPLTSISTNYNYKTGISVSGNNVLSQVVALILGGNSKIQTKSATLTQDKKVTNGSVVVVSGYQTINNYTATLNSLSLTAKSYAGVAYKFTDRQHTGGSN